MHDCLKLSNQLCFPLYALSKEIIRKYTPFLEAIGLTYPQYLVMLVLWEADGQSVSAIGARLYLDSGTLTPLLKRLEAKGLVRRRRGSSDERTVVITLTEEGRRLEREAAAVPGQVGNCVAMSAEEAAVIKAVTARLAAA